MLARLLDLAGPAEGISPRPLLGDPGQLEPQQLAQLYAGGILELPQDGRIALTPVFTQVARVLLQPRTNITFRLWNGDGLRGETSILFPGFIPGGGGVVLNQLGSYYRITAFIDDADVFNLVRPALPSAPDEPLDFEFQGHFEVTTAAVLFGVFDLVRRKAQSQKGKKAQKTVLFSPHMVGKFLRDEWGFTGFHQFISYVAAAGMKPEPPSQSETVQALQTLARAGALTEIDANQY